MAAETTLSDCAAQELEKLAAEGIHPTPAEIVKLNALGHEILTPRMRKHLSRGCPVYLSGIALWPLTMAAEDWYQREGIGMSGALSDVALAYAMANAYDESGKLNIFGEIAVAAVQAWRKSLRCTLAELRESVAQVLTQDARPIVPQNVDDAPLSVGEFSLILSAKTGTTPEFWERRCSTNYARDMLITIFMQERASGNPHPLDPSVQAEVIFGKYVEEIRKAHANV